MKVAVSWSGGMESNLAGHKAIVQGYEVDCLITFDFYQSPNARNITHPFSIMTLQSEALGIPHLKMKIEEPFLQSYRKAVLQLKETRGITGIVTGDIYAVDRIHGRWMENVCDGLGVEAIMPLWGQDSLKVLDEEVSAGFRAIFTCVKLPWFNRGWLGRKLDESALVDLDVLVKEFGIDPCGENGEYHTMCIDGPIYRKKIEVPDFIKERKNNTFYIKIIGDKP